MTIEGSPAARELLDALVALRRVHDHESPIQGLRHNEVMVLFALKRTREEGHVGLKVSEISSILKVTPSTITPSVRALEDGGWVERRTDAEDRRAVRVTLTPKGIQTLKEADERFIFRMKDLVAYLGEETSLQLAQILNQVVEYQKTRKPQ